MREQMMIRHFGPRGLLLAAASLCALAPAIAADSAFDDPNAAAKPTWEFARVRSKLQPGDKIGTYATGWCMTKLPFYAPPRAEDYANSNSAYAFKEVAKAIDLTLFQKDVSPFATDTPASADLRVGGTLTHEDLDWCVDNRKVKGTTNVDVKWEVWSTKQQRVVLTKSTSGHFKSDDYDADYEHKAYVEAMRALFDSPEIKDLVAGKLPAAKEAFEPLHVTARTIAEIDTQKNAPELKKAVVTIQSDAGSGSGFFVADNYLLTDRHVVGSSKYVKVRLWDGKDTVGEVVREDTGRDVALVKTAMPSDHILETRATDPASGENAFAIGSPLGQTLEGTFTRGVMSGTREIAGRRFFQSDVAVTHGNSGGPLLDGQSRVVGLTDWGIPQVSGLSFFVPIKEALDKLNLVVDSAPATSGTGTAH